MFAERHVAVTLEAPPDAVELGQRLEDRRIRDAELARDRNRGERIEHVVAAGKVERDLERGGALAPHAECHAPAVVLDGFARAAPRPRSCRR